MLRVSAGHEKGRDRSKKHVLEDHGEGAGGVNAAAGSVQVELAARDTCE
jgi:hypothetical protein